MSDPAPDPVPDEGALADRALWIAAVVEPVTLLVLVLNLATTRLEAVGSAVGPVHGLAYLIGIVACLVAGRSTRARLLSLVPGIGAWLAVRTPR